MWWCAPAVLQRLGLEKYLRILQKARVAALLQLGNQPTLHNKILSKKKKKSKGWPFQAGEMAPTKREREGSQA